MSKARDAKTAIMAGALVITGVCEFFEGLEEGINPLTSAGDAIRKTKERGKAVGEAWKKTRAKRRKRA